jgi:N-acyl-L-homoserine lactone synthetase
VVEIVTAANRSIYSDLIDDMHAMRYRVAIEKWGWKVPGIPPGYDKDAFVTDHTVYLIETDPDRRQVWGCARLNPTTKPHLMSEVFADACDLSGLAVGDHIWECSRFLIDRSRLPTPEDDAHTRQSVGIGITEFCLSAGITHLTWLTNQAFYNLALSVWDTRPLGLPRHYPDDDATYIPALSVIDEAALGRQRARLLKRRTDVTFVYMPLAALDGQNLLRPAA